ncbi:acyltransferase domain-containing protein [Nocardia testacea]|uniref:acyltransferase domain-containing protein n=1 Tax=Nocardia testacea TaxID=248551 RepID=UPI0009FD328A|nr:acyltransferase domain-containing protein [Nocardia testacea]
MIGSPQGVLFLFPGDGGEHERMGRMLAGRYPAFADAVTAAGDAVAAAGGPRVWTPRYGFRRPGAPVPGADTARPPAHPEFVQPALFVYQMALAELLIAWGVRPDAAVGHGPGEIAAAVTAGVLTLAEAAKVVVARGRAVGRAAGSSTTAELLTSESEVIRLVQPLAGKVTVAAVNGPRSVLVTGTSRYVDVVIRRAERRGIATARTPRDHPAHSPDMTEAIPRFLDDLGPVRSAAPRLPLYSSTYPGTVVGADDMSARYWAENLTGRVELDAALRRAADDGMAMVLEVGPEPLLAPAVRSIPRFAHTTYGAADSADEGTAFLTCLAQFHAARALGTATKGGNSNGRNGIEERSAPGARAITPAGRRPEQLGSGRHFPAASFDDCDPTAPANPAMAGPGRLSGGEDLRAEVTGAGTLASIRLADDPPPTDIIAWTRVVDANRAIRFMAGRVALDPPMMIDRAGTYVVSGGLGALGSVMVRRLLAAGARDVVVPTRSPRPVPPLLEGFEERIVVVRCDTADRHDLDNALRDIRETGCTIRGVIHAAQVFEDTVVDAAVSGDIATGSAIIAPESSVGHRDSALDAGRLARRFARISASAAHLIELTAADPVAFIAVFATPVMGTPRSTDSPWAYTGTTDSPDPPPVPANTEPPTWPEHLDHAPER